jgi:hypothetical protein
VSGVFRQSDLPERDLRHPEQPSGRQLSYLRFDHLPDGVLHANVGLRNGREQRCLRTQRKRMHRVHGQPELPEWSLRGQSGPGWRPQVQPDHMPYGLL